MINNNVFNSEVEIGVRILVLLEQSQKKLDLQEIIFYDYLILYYGDVDSNYESLHPGNPLHSTEYIIKRNLIREGLNIISKKGLIEIEFSDQGVKYYAAKNGKYFLSYLESEYYLKVVKYSKLVTSKFRDYSLEELNEYFQSNVGAWNGEFEKEIVFRRI